MIVAHTSTMSFPGEAIKHIDLCHSIAKYLSAFYFNNFSGMSK